MSESHRGWHEEPLERAPESSRSGARKRWRRGADTIEEWWEYCECCMTYGGTFFRGYTDEGSNNHWAVCSTATFDAAAEVLRKKASGEDVAERLERDAAEARARVRVVRDE